MNKASTFKVESYRPKAMAFQTSTFGTKNLKTQGTKLLGFNS
jgi:hypothetical protein